MNRTLAISLLSLSAMFTACQSDDPAIGEGGKTDGMNIGYIAVNIVQPSSTGSRAGTETTGPSAGFEYGSDDENFAEKALFFLFKQNGDLYKSVEVNLNGSGTGTSPEVERIYNTVLVIDGADADPSANVENIVCVLNAPDEFTTTDTSKKYTVTKLTDLQKKIGEYSASTRGKFIMTNSVYTANGQFATSASGKIKTSAAEAQNNPINIYVERVVAKVEASFKSTTDFTNGGAKPVIDGNETELGITITGIEVANIAEKSYLFKDVTGATTATEGIWKEAGVFDTNNKRSYWETVPGIGTNTNEMGLDNISYTDIVALTPSTTAEGDAEENTEEGGTTKYSSIISKWGSANPFKLYIQPNTTDEAAGALKTKKTCILVTAQLTKSKIDDTPYTDLAYIRGGYTSIDKAKNVVAAYLATLGYYKKDDANHYVQLSANDLEWKNKYDFTEASTERGELDWLEDYEVVAQIVSSVDKLYDIEGHEIENGVTTVNKLLRGKNSDDSDNATAKNYRARVFKDGLCYYYKAIDHSSVLSADAGKYEGVVRNHIYRLTLSSIEGIGTPVFDPSDVIIPQTPGDETKFYLGAKVNVLAWKVATQDVQFQGK